MMKKISITILILLSLGVAACSKANVNDSTSGNITSTTKVEASNPTTITPEDAKKRLDSEKGIILLDVREPDEYAVGHIKNSILFPLGTIESEAPTKLTDKNATIFVYCHSGRRSALAAATLVKLGYTKIFDLGGIINWPYEVISGK